MTEALTFLMTDVVGSTSMWERSPEPMAEALARHDEIIASAVEAAGGDLPKGRGEGDSHFAVFEEPAGAIDAALVAQRALLAEEWPGGLDLTVRMAVHVGPVERRGGDFYGPTVNRCARLRAVAPPSAVLASEAVAAALAGAAEAAASLQPLGTRRLKDLQRPERIHVLVHPDLPVIDALPGGPAHNLPSEGAPLVGRDAEVAELVDRLATERVVHVTGPGGSGKSRVALAASRRCLGRHVDGVWWVDLAGVSDDGVAAAVAEALAIADTGTAAIADLEAWAARRDSLVVLDRTDDGPKGAAEVADRIATGAVRVLTTGRSTPPGAAAVRLGPLRRDAVVELFCDRVRQADQEVDPSDRRVAALCDRLDGLPLAVELAAAAAATSGVDAVAEDLERHLGLGEAVGAPGPTLAATLAWSHDRLPEPAQRLFRLLSVMPAGFTPEAAASLAGDGQPAGELLDALVGASLVSPPDEHTGRLRMLEPVRLFAARRLDRSGDAWVAQERRLGWLSALAAEAARALLGPDQAAWLDRLDAERHTFEAAADSAAAMPDLAPSTMAAVAAVRRFWELRGHWRVGRRLLEWAAGSTDPGVAAEAALGAGRLAFRHADLDAAEAHFARASASGGSVGALAMVGRGDLAHVRDDMSAAEAIYRGVLELAADLDDPEVTAAAQHALGNVARATGRLSEASEHYTTAAASAEAVGDLRRSLAARLALAEVALGTGAVDDAARDFDRCIGQAVRLGDVELIGVALYGLASVALEQSDLSRARALLEESLALADDVGDPLGSAFTTLSLGEVLMELGDEAAIDRLTDAAHRFELVEHPHGVAAAHASLAEAARRRGDRSAVLRHTAAAGATGAPSPDVVGALAATAALVLAEAGQQDQALGMVGLARSNPGLWDLDRRADEITALVEAASGVDPAGAEAALEKGAGWGAEVLVDRLRALPTGHLAGADGAPALGQP